MSAAMQGILDKFVMKVKEGRAKKMEDAKSPLLNTDAWTWLFWLFWLTKSEEPFG